MIYRIAFSLLLTLTSFSLQAKDSYFFKGLNKDWSMPWDGHQGVLSLDIPFCIDQSLASYGQTQSTQTPKINYKIQVIGSVGANGLFEASKGQEKIPFELSLVSNGSPHDLKNGADSQELTSSSLCPSGQLKLSVKTKGDLHKIKAGDYRASLRVRAQSNDINISQDGLIDLTIKIPKIVSIKTPDPIKLRALHKLKEETYICVYRNGHEAYNLKATGLNNKKGDFQVFLDGASGQAGEHKALNYDVSITPPGGSRITLVPNNLAKGLMGSSDPGCNGREQLKLEVSVNKKAAQNVYAGKYQGQLKLTVEVQ